MSSNVKKQLPVLEFLKVCPPKIRKLIIKEAESSLILAICEICLNFCKGNVKLPKENFIKLKKHSKAIYKLARTKKSNKDLKAQRSILYQKGGGAFLPILLAPVLSGLTEYFVKKII